MRYTRYLALTAALPLAAAVLAAQATTSPTPPTATLTPIVQVSDTIVDATASQGGRLIVYATKSNELRVYDRDARTTTLVMRTPATAVVMSPKGDRLVIMRRPEGSKEDYLWTIPVDPKSAVATGEVRRVSLRAASNPRFSPDGRWIAFTTAGKAAKLLVIPAEGGAERVVTEGIGGPVRWSPDGKWIYVSLDMPDKKSCVVARVPAAGGKPEAMSPPVALGCYPGLSPDGRFAVAATGFDGGFLTGSIFDDNKRLVGNVRMSATVDPIAWLNDGLHMLATREEAPSALHSVSMAGGGDRLLMQGKEPPVRFSMSPDGKQVFVSVPAGTGHKRVVMNADGSNQRTVFSGGFSTNWNAEQNWSPDGKYIAFRDETMTGSTLNVVDVATGTSRVVAKPELAVMQFRWRSDSRAIVYGHRSGNWEHGRTTVREVTLDGAERVLLDLADRPLSNGGVMFVGDSGVLVPGGGFFGTFHSTELKAMIDTVPTARRGGQQWAPAASRDGRWIAHQAVSDPSNQTIEVLSVDGKTRFAVKQPFPHGWGTTRQFDGDGRNIVAASGPTPGSPAAIYAIPVAGGAPRVIVTLAPGTHVSEFSVSPDGKTVLYSTSGALTTTLLDVDLGVGLPARLPKQ